MISRLSSESQGKYQILKQQNQELLGQQAHQQDELSILDSNIHKLESDIKADPAKQKALGKIEITQKKD